MVGGGEEWSLKEPASWRSLCRWVRKSSISFSWPGREDGEDSASEPLEEENPLSLLKRKVAQMWLCLVSAGIPEGETVIISGSSLPISYWRFSQNKYLSAVLSLYPGGKFVTKSNAFLKS